MCAYVDKVKKYVDMLVNMGRVFPEELAIDMILISLPKCYKSFMDNFHLNNHGVPLMGLSTMLRAEEVRIIKMEVIARCKEIIDDEFEQVVVSLLHKNERIVNGIFK